MTLTECVPNFSEGRRVEIVDEIVATIAAVDGVAMLDRQSDAVHNRSVITFAGQDAAVAKLGLDASAKPFDFVFHGGSGSLKSEIEEAVGYGVIKMNVDTDTQYAFTRPVAAHMFTNYDGVLKVDGEVGNKKTYDPRSYLKKAEQAMSERVVEACHDLKSAGKSQGAKA